MVDILVTLVHIFLVAGLMQRCNVFFYRTKRADAAGFTLSLRTIGYLLALGSFIALLALSDAAITYVDYFIGQLALLGIHTSWWPALIAGALLATAQRQWRLNRMLRARFQLAAVVIMLLVSVYGIGMPGWVAQPVQALIEEPQQQTAVVDSADRQVYRTGPTYVVYLDGRRYTTPDSAWFDTLRPGASVDFIASAHAPVAFDPDRVRYAGQGELIILAALPCWALTFVLAGEGVLRLGRSVATLVKRSKVPLEHAG